MKSMKKVLVFAAIASIFGLPQPVVAKTKDGAAALVLLAATGGLGYAAKKAYYKMHQARTETEKGRAQRRFIFAVLGALAAGAGTAYTGHTYFNDSSEEPKPKTPGASAVSAAPQASVSVRGSRAGAARKPRRKKEGQVQRVAELPTPLRASPVSSVPDIAQAPAQRSPAQGVAPDGQLAAAHASAEAVNVRSDRAITPMAVPVVENQAQVEAPAAVSAASAAQGHRSGPPAAAEDLACVLDSNLCVQRSGGTDFSLSALAAENIRAVLRRDGVVPSQFCRISMPQSYFLTGRRRGSPEYLYLFDLNGHQVRSEDFQNQFQGSSLVSANFQMVYRGAESINARFERAIASAAAPERGTPATTVMGARTISARLTESGPVQSIELLADGRLSEASRRALHPFNLRGWIALPTELSSFAMVVKLEKLWEFPDTFLCVGVEGRVFWFESVAGGRVQAVSDLNYLSQGLTSTQLLIKAVDVPATETFLPLENGLSLGLLLRDAQRIELSHLHTTPAQLLANSRGYNWAGLPEVPAIIRERRPAAGGWRGYVVLRYEVPRVSDLWIGVDIESGGGCIAVMDNRRILNTVFLDVIGQRPVLRMLPEVLPIDVRQARLKEDLARMLEARDRGLAGTIRSNPDITAEMLCNFSGVGSSLMKELIERWDECYYDTFSEVVAALQERFPAIDWVNADIGSKAPACHAIDSNKPVLAQALLGISDAERAASVTIHSGLTVLHYAVYRAEPPAFAQLFTGGTSSRDRAVQCLRAVLNQPNAQGFTPLMLAMQMQDFGYAQVLLDNGASVELPAGQGDIRRYAARISTQEMFDALIAHPRVQSACPVYNEPVVWDASDDVAAPHGGIRWSLALPGAGGRILLTYNPESQIIASDEILRLHQVNRAGGADVAAEPRLNTYPLVVALASASSPYWMCIDARGHVTMFNRISPAGGGSRVVDYDGGCWDAGLTILRVAR